ncbi:MAG TPA: hypothetical protein VGO03_16185 [Acidimicrobiia bacterium]|jgi:hypothetical protein
MTSPAPLDRLSAALATFDDDALDDAIRALGEGEHLVELAQALNAKRPALLSHPHPSSLVRPRIYSGPPGRRVLAALSIAGPCSDDCIEMLGDQADEPTREDMDGVLDELVERWGAQMVTLMLAAYPAMDAPAGPVFAEILDSDERFAIPDSAYEAAKEAGHAAGARASDTPAIDQHGLDIARAERQRKIALDAQRLRKRKK